MIARPSDVRTAAAHALAKGCYCWLPWDVEVPALTIDMGGGAIGALVLSGDRALNCYSLAREPAILPYVSNVALLVEVNSNPRQADRIRRASYFGLVCFHTDGAQLIIKIPGPDHSYELRPLSLVDLVLGAAPDMWNHHKFVEDWRILVRTTDSQNYFPVAQAVVE
jgi:hypothetical protein